MRDYSRKDISQMTEQFCDSFLAEISNYTDGLEKMSYYYDTKRKLMRLTLIGSPETVVKLIQYCDLSNGKSD